MQDVKLAITVFADGLAPSGARPSAGTVTATISRLFYINRHIDDNNFKTTCKVWLS